MAPIPGALLQNDVPIGNLEPLLSNKCQSHLEGDVKSEEESNDFRSAAKGQTLFWIAIMLAIPDTVPYRFV
jgi:hypothetical protein